MSDSEDLKEQEQIKFAQKESKKDNRGKKGKNKKDKSAKDGARGNKDKEPAPDKKNGTDRAEVICRAFGCFLVFVANSRGFRLM